MTHPNIELLRRAWAAYDRGDVEAFAACLSDDWRESGPRGPRSGIRDARRRATDNGAAPRRFPVKHTEIHTAVADDDVVGCHCTVTATHTGRYLDLEPTGKRVVVHEMMFNRVRDGRVVETWAMTDGDGFYEQLAGRPAPEGLDNLA